MQRTEEDIMNTTDAVLKTENTIYHTELIRKLAEMGKTSVIKNHFEVVQDFLKMMPYQDRYMIWSLLS